MVKKAKSVVKKEFLGSGIDLIGSIGDITKFKKLPDGWVRWELIKRDFGLEAKNYMPWEDGKKYAADMGARLGTRLEHFLLFCAMKANPEIRTKFFPHAQERWYWTEEESGISCAWCVSFSYGDVDYVDKGDDYYVRPVRASQSLII